LSSCWTRPLAAALGLMVAWMGARVVADPASAAARAESELAQVTVEAVDAILEAEQAAERLPPPPLAPALESVRRQGQDLLDQARLIYQTATRTGSVEPLRRARRLAERASNRFLRLDAAAGGEGHSGAEASKQLSTAATALFSGSYMEAEHLLEHIDDADPAAGQLLMLRAAARYALYRLSGEQNALLAWKAVADIRRCHMLAPDLVPDPEFFSPRFRRLFALVPPAEGPG
jgi:hypothetical protein